MDTHITWKSLTNKLYSTRLSPLVHGYAVQTSAYAPTPAEATGNALFASFTFCTRRAQLVVVRRVTPNDVERISGMLSKLSLRTRTLRYLVPRSMTDAEARHEAQRIARGHTEDHVSLIATQPHDQVVVAIAELVRNAQQPTEGEFALVVRDHEQGQGIGSMLLARLTQIAPMLGIVTLYAHVLPENRALLALVRKLHLPYTTSFHASDPDMFVQVAVTGTTAG
jgi:GNAT superfamily N-acetyltransferase